MPLSMYTSSAGDLVVMEHHGVFGIWPTYGETHDTQIYVPWPGTVRYRFRLSSNNEYSKTVYIKINTTEYGPYNIPANSYVDCNIDYTISSPSMLLVDMRASATWTQCKKLALKTGNPDCMYKATIRVPYNYYEVTDPHVVL